MKLLQKKFNSVFANFHEQVEPSAPERVAIISRPGGRRLESDLSECIRGKWEKYQTHFNADLPAENKAWEEIGGNFTRLELLQRLEKAWANLEPNTEIRCTNAARIALEHQPIDSESKSPEEAESCQKLTANAMIVQWQDIAKKEQELRWFQVPKESTTQNEWKRRTGFASSVCSWNSVSSRRTSRKCQKSFQVAYLDVISPQTIINLDREAE